MRGLVAHSLLAPLHPARWATASCMCKHTVTQFGFACRDVATCSSRAALPGNLDCHAGRIAPRAGRKD